MKPKLSWRALQMLDGEDEKEFMSAFNRLRRRQVKHFKKPVDFGKYIKSAIIYHKNYSLHFPNSANYFKQYKEIFEFAARRWDLFSKYPHAIKMGEIPEEIKEIKEKFDALKSFSELGS